jgi:hypothetical protein
MQVYFQNNFVKLSYDLKLRLGKAKWKGRLHGAELREAYLLCLEMINRYALTKWLADDRRMGAIAPADLEWSLEVHVPNMVKSSLLRLARLPSQYEQNREAVETMINKGHTLNLRMAVRDFMDEADAMGWLLEPAKISMTQTSLLI